MLDDKPVPPPPETLARERALLLPDEPPPPSPSLQGVDAQLTRIERTLSAQERLTLHRVGEGRWIASWFDPGVAAYQSADEPTPERALRELAKKIL